MKEVTSKLKRMYTNANCLNNKKTELQARIHEHKPHIIGITEVWAKDQFSIEGYHLAIHKHRADGQIGGGVLILVKSNLQVQECEELNNADFADSVWCIVCPQDAHGKILAGVCYRSPRSSDANNSKLNGLIGMAVKQHATSFLLMGDFNYNQINWKTGVVAAGEESPPSKFYQSTQNNFLCQHVLVPTRYRDGCSPSNLDLIFTKRESDVEDLAICDPLGKSDHVVLIWELILKTKAQISAVRLGYNYHKADYEKMQTISFKARLEGNEKLAC